MTPFIRHVAASLVLSGALLASHATAAPKADFRIRFEQPEHYVDAYLRSGSGDAARAPTLEAIATTLHRQSDRYLRAGQTLEIDVLDIDLAGRQEPWRPTAADLRIMRDVDWPRVRLRYRLIETGKPIREGEAVISDKTYLMRAGTRRVDDPFRYEKAMLEDWFRRQFGAQG